MRPASNIFRILRQTAPGFSQDAFVCRRCIQQQASPPPQIAYKSLRQTPFLKAFRSQHQKSVSNTIRHNSSASASASTSSAPAALSLGHLAKTPSIRRASRKSKSFFPETSSKSVAYWLLGSAASVFGIVVFGGLTRLTESGFVPSGQREPVLSDRLTDFSAVLV